MCKTCAEVQVRDDSDVQLAHEFSDRCTSLSASDDPEVPGVKHDDGKPRPALLPPLAVLEVAEVLRLGALKYSDDNWRRVPDWRKRYADAALRHVFGWLAGQEKDGETGCHALAHAVCCLLYLVEQEMRGVADVPMEVPPDA